MPSADTVHQSITIDAPVSEVYAFLTDWERWPEWMSRVREVRASGAHDAEGECTHWVVDGPMGKTVEWDAVTTKLEPRKVVEWKTVGSPLVRHSGTMRFVADGDGATRVDVRMSYSPIGGAIGRAIASALRRDSKRQFDDDLARLKTTIERART